VPRAADFERLFLIASFRGTKDALARVQAMDDCFSVITFLEGEANNEV
jgi:hypothetical protein